MNRRTFLAGALTTAAGLILPYEPKRIYSFPSKGFAQPELYEELLIHSIKEGLQGSYNVQASIINHDEKVEPINLSIAVYQFGVEWTEPPPYTRVEEAVRLHLAEARRLIV